MVKLSLITVTFFTLAVSLLIIRDDSSSVTKNPPLGNTPETFEKDYLRNEQNNWEESEKSESGVAEFLRLRAFDSLDWFNLRLKSFIDNRFFEFGEFKDFQNKLQTQITDIATFIKKENIKSREILAQLTFAEHMFKVMTDSAELLDFFALKKGTPQKIICKTIQLNIRLFNLQNSKGVPDTGLEYYTSKVVRLTKRLRSWEIKFYNLREVPPLSIQSAFKNQHAQAKEKLDFLGRYISNPLE